MSQFAWMGEDLDPARPLSHVLEGSMLGVSEDVMVMSCLFIYVLTTGEGHSVFCKGGRGRVAWHGVAWRGAGAAKPVLPD